MEAIVAVYDNWGIGANGTQPIALHADRAFFRETTRGAAVVVGRRTAADFPSGKPLPGRKNFLLTRSVGEYPGFIVCASVEELLRAVRICPRVFVIGGGSVYAALLPYCDRVTVTKLSVQVPCDTWFPNLDNSPEWTQSCVLREGEENGIAYKMLVYTRI